jgi:purine-binding chemotaxis protein CheW
MEKQFVVFELAQESFGVPIEAVEGIIKLQKITSMPNLPGYIEGVTNLRGSIVPVLDLRKRFSLPTGAETNDTRIVIVRMDVVSIGMIVDSVSEVLTIDDAVIESIPPLLSTVDTAFITGIANLGDRLVILLSLEAVLSSDENREMVNLTDALLTPA